MVKTRKTRKAVEESSIVDVEDVEDVEDEDEEEVESPVLVKASEPPKVLPKIAQAPAKKEFTAILQNASTLTLAGIKFMKNVPTKVPMIHLKLIKDHGWFRIIV